ncbi:unnamed protein product [Notodromas monacha]|uniref:BAR domain-containing protein n=1 Tax=Notodromas monacha TaxID=399045 RepID=A0A7R9BHN2_9CRUS|nr:unnamed protein product [Notodromas monacha]CAG0914268.1 unnamed protein product [Notodromas monacha]
MPDLCSFLVNLKELGEACVKLTSPTRQSTDSVEVLISSTSEEKRPKVPPRSKRIAALPRNVASEEDSVDADVASVRNRSKPPERPKSSYRGAIISDVPSSSTTAVKPVTDRGLQIVPDARDVCVGDSKVHVVTEEDGEEGILKMRQRFHDMLDDAFRAFGNEDLVMAKVEVNSGDLPPPLPEKRARSAADSRANFDRPEKARPISALLKSGSTVADGNVLTLTVPPKPAWGTDPRFDVDVQASSGQFVRGRSNAPPPSPEMMMGDGLRNYEPIDPDSGLRMNDPAVPVIKAIKEELKRFDSTPAEKSSSKRVYRVRLLKESLTTPSLPPQHLQYAGHLEIAEIVGKFQACQKASRKLLEDGKKYGKSLKTLSAMEVRLLSDFNTGGVVRDGEPVKEVLSGHQSIANQAVREANDLDKLAKETVIEPLNKFQKVFTAVNERLKARDEQISAIMKLSEKLEKLRKPGSNLQKKWKIPQVAQQKQMLEAEFVDSERVLVEELRGLFDLRLKYFQPILQAHALAQINFYGEQCKIFGHVAAGLPESVAPVSNKEFQGFLNSSVERLKELKIIRVSEA